MLCRCLANPLVTRNDFSAVTSVFNPGAIKIDDRYLLMLRVQLRSRETVLYMAESSDGIQFSVSTEPVKLNGIESVDERIFHVYDPRITKIDSTYYVMFAMDTESGCKVGLAESSEMKNFTFKGIVS